MNDNDHLIWHTEQRKLGELIGWNKNPRKLSKHNAEQIRKSIAGFGFADPFIVNTNNHLIGGHQRKKVMLSDGYKLEDLVDVRIPSRELTEQEAAELAVRLNKNTGEWDFAILENHFSKIDLLNWGFTDNELKGLNFDDQLSEDPGAQIDKAEELRQKWNVKSGQLWKLGDHQLLCGDSTKKENVERLMGKEKAKMIFTDPPWNIGIGGDSNPRHRQRALLENDNLSEDNYAIFVQAFIQIFIYACEGDLYCVMGASKWPTLDANLRAGGYYWSATIIWVKDVFVLGRSKYHRRYEPIWYGWHKSGKSSFCEKRDLDDVWKIARPKNSDEHPTMKPIELIKRAIQNSSMSGNLVFDPFVGSGTTIIACEQLGRKCRAIEISPAYCAVAIQRWVDMTRKKPELMEA